MKDFLLSSELSKKLYLAVKDLPIIDYHCHLNVNEILDDKHYDNITQIWLSRDHYKWRLMRHFGINERYITGDAPDYDKFEKYLEALSYAIGSPLYHWSQMELLKYFNIKTSIKKENAKSIFESANEFIAKKCFSPAKAITESNVEIICTTEEIYCDLSAHNKISKNGNISAKVLPSFRGDKAINIVDLEFKTNINKLASVAMCSITDLKSLKAALTARLDSFKSAGCVTVDFAIEGLNWVEVSDGAVDKIFQNALNGKLENSDGYICYMLKFFLSQCYERGFSVQLHIGAMRNNNQHAFRALGADAGYDSISGKPYLSGLKSLLNAVGKIGKTIIFNLNPADNASIATLCGCYAGEIKGKMQFGAAWWFNDTKSGILEQMSALSNLGHFATFVGMLTDSRSFISYPRHDYFRRILCDYVAKLSLSGEFTDDINILEKLVKDVSYYNAKEYFI